jgi:hypothetical protein
MTDNMEKDAVHRNLWDLSFGLRPADELYDCIKDPRVTGGADKFDTYPYYGGGPKHPSFIEE